MIEGKIANQPINLKFKNVDKALCSKCRKLIDYPHSTVIRTKGGKYFVYSYLETEHFIYETKSGDAVAYCSKYCASKHNHRFTKKGK